EADKWQS
nr:Chain C, GP41 PEPTIDE ANALOG [Human immunodeficiency virus 1]